MMWRPEALKLDREAQSGKAASVRESDEER